MRCLRFTPWGRPNLHCYPWFEHMRQDPIERIEANESEREYSIFQNLIYLQAGDSDQHKKRLPSDWAFRNWTVTSTAPLPREQCENDRRRWDKHSIPRVVVTSIIGVQRRQER